MDVKAPVSEAELSALNHEVESKQIDGYLWLNVKPGTALPEATYASRGSADFIGRDRMQYSIGHALVREELVKRGTTGEQIDLLLQEVDLKTLQVKNGRALAADAGKGFWGAYLMAFMLYFAVVFYGVNVAQSVVGGKDFAGLRSAAGLSQAGVADAGQAAGRGRSGADADGDLDQLPSPAERVVVGDDVGHGGVAAYGVTPLQLIFFVLYFLLGFFFYSALSAGLGATVSQESEVQQFTMIIVMPQLIGLVLIVYILSNPGAWPVVLLSLFPPSTPIVMSLRMAAMPVPAWQLALSLVLMVSSIYAMVWVASRIYRVGILMYGKRPTLPEMLRWLKYS